jgi:hypothetical protein
MRTNQLRYARIAILVSICFLAILILNGCLSTPSPSPTLSPTETQIQSPTQPSLPKLGITPPATRCDPISATSGNGQTILTLPDGSQIYLAADTEIEFTPAGYCPELKEHNIFIKRGQVAIRSLLASGKSIVITSPDGYIALVSDTGMVTFDVTGHIFTLACTNGGCALGPDSTKLTSLDCRQSANLDSAGNFKGPSPVDPAPLAQYGDWLLPKCSLPTATSTPTPKVVTPDIAATATAYCVSFKNQFQLTPCPAYKP